MSNVLPESAQRKVWRMCRARFIIAGSAVFGVAALLSAATLVPSALIVSGDAQSILAGSPGVHNEKDSTDRTEMVRAQLLLTQLHPLLSATTSPSGAVAFALASRPSGVTIERISYTSGDEGSLIIVGTALARELIEAFRAALSADPHFSDVSVPVGDLIGVGGGHFSITLSGAF